MKYKKFYLIVLCLFLLFYSVLPISYADDLNSEENLSSDYHSIENVSKDLNAIPTINARYAAIYDRASGTLLYDKNSNEKSKMASTTKIMTSLVVIENSNLSDIVTISKKSAGTGGSRLGLSTNNTISVENLLYGLMLCSGNDAAVALAEHVGGSIEGFAELMNKKALELNLTNTHFVTPHGLDQDDHYTTAYELAKLTDYALKNEIFAKIVNTKNYTIMINNTPKQIHNTNELLGNLDGVYGVKTGFTNGANRCLVTSCKRGNLDIICVVLGCDTKKDRTQDSIDLINYTFNNFTIKNLEEIIDNDFNSWITNHANKFTINKGITNNIDLYLDKSNLPYYNLAVNNTDINNITSTITCTSSFNAPLEENSIIGTSTIKINEKELFKINIINKNTIRKKYIFDYFHSFFYRYPDIIKTTF